MESKKCCHCNQYKSLDLFIKSKNDPGGYTYDCKSCRKEKRKPRDPQLNREYYLKTKTEKEKRRLERLAPIRVAQKIIREEKEKARIEMREKTKFERESLLKFKAKERYEKNKSYILLKRKAYVSKNHEIIKQKARDRNKCPLMKKKVREYISEKKKNNLLYKLKCTLRSRMTTAFKSASIKKKESSINLLGAPIEIVKKHIERQFQKGMTWENHGYYIWHIDHIIPLKSATNEEEIKILFHYKNLRPLWAKENLKKSGKIIESQTYMAI